MFLTPPGHILFKTHLPQKPEKWQYLNKYLKLEEKKQGHFLLYKFLSLLTSAFRIVAYFPRYGHFLVFHPYKKYFSPEYLGIKYLWKNTKKGIKSKIGVILICSLIWRKIILNNWGIHKVKLRNSTQDLSPPHPLLLGKFLILTNPPPVLPLWSLF